ncbi:MAG: DUF3108 domain-containing protein [Candidatus Glassbacteria bacterium]|nr:DUF3108 domain-containing protein [Candidatus Glassbacteria bacterium]
MSPWRAELPKSVITILAALAFASSSCGNLQADGDQPAPFAVGERLEFSINWSVANIGTAYMRINGIEEVNGHSCYQVEAGAKSNKTIDLFYPVRDRFFSYIDRQELFSRKFIKEQKEGKHERYLELLYDQEANEVNDLVSGEIKECVPEAQDELSIFYYFRSLDLEVGEGVLLEGFVDKRGNPLKVAVHRKEWVDVPAGRFYCTVVEPFIKSGGLFKHKGSLQIWLTDDKRRIPVKVSSELDFGKIVVLLESYQPGGPES